MSGISHHKKIVVPGFSFSGISSGIKKSKSKDLALIVSEKPAVIAGRFTANKIKAAPVKLAIESLARHKKCQVIIMNSGNANACTGHRGLKNAREMIAETAKEFGISPELVYASSTGIIGEQLPLEKIKKALPSLRKKLSPLSLHRAASAIMTTDTFAKVSAKKIKIGNKTGIIAGIAKGAGMIRPDMATMLCFLMTDIAVSQNALDAALREAVRNSFNRLSVDNDTSTNDTVVVLANGMLNNSAISKRSPFYDRFENALRNVSCNLARMIAQDGEGATKLVEIVVKGAKSEPDAEKVAAAVSQSMLVKTALYGSDPNWGRIMAAIGYSGAEISEHKIDISINKIKVVSGGLGTQKEKSARSALRNKKVRITINLGKGKKTVQYLSCDLTEQYIKINAHYST